MGIRTTVLIMERCVTDPCCPGNDVTVSCSSANLKYASAGREWQQIAVQKEELLLASGLLQIFRRSSILMLIIESRGGVDRLNDPKSYPATFLEQVFGVQSLRLVEDYNAIIPIQPKVLRHPQPALYGGLSDQYISYSLLVLSLIIWGSIWKFWHYCLLQLICCSFPISVKEACSYDSRISQKR